MVLLEIDKNYTHNDRLLGEHRWQEFLKNPSKEEKDRVSQIFHCLYTTGREAQKDGTSSNLFITITCSQSILQVGNVFTSRARGSSLAALKTRVALKGLRNHVARKTRVALNGRTPLFFFQPLINLTANLVIIV